MEKKRFLASVKGPSFVVSLILVVFFFKGVFLSALQPIFVGQDEARHYNTVQYLAEPKETKVTIGKIPVAETRDNNDLSTYRYSEEIKGTATATDTNILRSDLYNTIKFSDDENGLNEAEIMKMQWPAINLDTPDIASSNSLYHKTASLIETFFAHQTILVRFYLIRIFSVLLATFAVFFFYLTTKTIGFSEKHALILTAILSFHPKFTFYSTNINYDALLIPAFFLFVYASTLTLKKGLHWKNLLLLLLSTVIAFETKATGYVLVIVFICLLAYFLFEKVRTYNKRVRSIAYTLSVIACFGIAFSLILHQTILGSHSLGQTVNTLQNYLSKTLSLGMFLSPSTTYWGILSWVNSWSLTNATNVILVVQILAVLGLVLLFFSKREFPKFLPEKKYILFLIGMTAALQLGIRFADWTIFDRYGIIGLGTPGRYFIPNLPAHILLTFIGLGVLLTYFKKKNISIPSSPRA